MIRPLAVRCCCALAALAGAWAAYTQNPPAPRPLSIQKVKEDLYNIAGDGGNVAVYITGEGVILVDDMYDRNYADIMAKVQTVTGQPVKYVLNTHQHDDHAGGNAKMMSSAEVIAHRNVRLNMAALKQPGQPRVTFDTGMSVFLGGKEVRSHYYGRGHTNGDAVIYFPALKTIHTGDLFLTIAFLPFMDFAQGGSAVEWTKTLDGLLGLDFDTVIPGHGPISDRAGILKWRADFVKMRDRIEGMVKSGKSKDEVSAVLVNEFKWPAGGLAIQQVDAFIAEMRAQR
jgi:cyclase